MNHFYQVIRGKTVFVIHEYMFGTRTENTEHKSLEDINNCLNCIPHHFTQLATIWTTDKTVKDAADY